MAELEVAAEEDEELNRQEHVLNRLKLFSLSRPPPPPLVILFYFF